MIDVARGDVLLGRANLLFESLARVIGPNLEGRTVRRRVARKTSLELALQGRDKLTFIVSEPIDSFGLWVEQLVAESTGKHGKGILPVADEPLGDPGVYGDDRVFVYLRNGASPDAELDEAVDAMVADLVRIVYREATLR